LLQKGPGLADGDHERQGTIVAQSARGGRGNNELGTCYNYGRSSTRDSVAA
jgi:hypothetical protein